MLMPHDFRARIRAGLDRARLAGKRLGRPRKTAPTIPMLGGTTRAAAKVWGVSKSTAARWITAGPRVPIARVLEEALEAYQRDQPTQRPLVRRYQPTPEELAASRRWPREPPPELETIWSGGAPLICKDSGMGSSLSGVAYPLRTRLS